MVLDLIQLVALLIVLVGFALLLTLGLALVVNGSLILVAALAFEIKQGSDSRPGLRMARRMRRD